jgi:hypothetical protein
VKPMLIKMAVAAGSLLISNAVFSQTIPPPAKKAAHVEITQGPVLEVARGDLAIVRWTTNNPGGRTIISPSCTMVRIPRI